MTYDGDCPNCRAEGGVKLCQLHAAAPALLEALKWAIQTIERVSQVYEIDHTSNDPSGTNWDMLFDAKAALTRAEGHEPEGTTNAA